MSAERFIETEDGARIRVVAEGRGPLVFFLHGIGGNAGQWLGVTRALHAKTATIAWDARGYGGSEGPEIKRFSRFADDLCAVIEGFGGGPVLGVGHSMGGRILIEAALTRPELFAALLLSGTQPAYLAHLSADERNRYVTRRLGMFEGGRVSRARARAVAQEVLPPTAPDLLVDTLAADFQRLRPEGYAAALRMSAGWDRRADLGRLAIPVEVVGGALDPVCPPQETRALGEAVGAHRVTLLDGVSHMMQLEAPETVTDLVSGFVARYGTRARQANLDAEVAR